jgi:phenylpropionate dioxygenase-like ring-hydroxylating dioxygenase large terminal subunit
MYPFRAGSFAVHNGWYVAAFAHEVTRSLVARTILNQPVVLYRRQDGVAVAVGGRCPHRHFPLAAGCLRGDSIECGYHGITFGADGQCVAIPSQSLVPQVYRIPTYPLVEHGLWLWIWMGAADQADPGLLPDLEAIGLRDPGMVARPFYAQEVQGRYQLLNDNLLDLTHLAFLHRASIGTVENASAVEELAKRPGFLSSRRFIRNAAAPPVMAATGRYSGRIDRVTGMDFYLPGFHAGIGDMLYPADHPEHAGESIVKSRVYHAVTPSTYRSCLYFFAMASPDEAGLEQMFELLKPVIDEDKFATEQIEKMLAIIGENPAELLLRSDRNAVEGRRMLQAMMDAEHVAAHHSGAPPLVPEVGVEPTRF